MNSSKRQIGQELGKAEAAAFFESNYVNVVAAARAPFPGGYFDYPYSGEYLVRSESNELITYVPDTDNEGFLPSFIGSCPDDLKLADFASRFVIDGNYEVGAAVAMYFREENFADESYFWQLLPENYWFSGNEQFPGLFEQLDARLMNESEIYRRVVDLLKNFDSAENQVVKSRIESDDSFASFYE